MTSEQFFQKVVQMREAQRMYFRTRYSEHLKQSKSLEKEIDTEIERVKTIITKRQEPSLF